MTRDGPKAEEPGQFDASRLVKAAKILAVLEDYLQSDLDSLRCLDIGCASGIISGYLAERFAFTIGIDPVEEVVGRDSPRESSARLSFAAASGENIPFPGGSFDLVICTQVYEHTSNPVSLASEIHRVLRPEGVCYFSGPNRLAIIEEHYWLPFLSWLPRPLSDLYMRVSGKGAKYDAYPYYYWQLRRLWRRFEFHDYTVPMLRSPEHFSVSDRVKSSSFLEHVPDFALRALAPLYPNYNWVLVKRP